MKLILFIALSTVHFGVYGQVILQVVQKGNDNDYQVPVDTTLQGSDYHYSWNHAGSHTKWPWFEAFKYCQNLGPGWSPISINDQEENNIVITAMSQSNVRYIWTSGHLGPNGFIWCDGSPVLSIGWSYTGGLGKPQPDNREGNENCLAVLNHVYQDGIKWHDIACHYEKLVICERKRS